MVEGRITFPDDGSPSKDLTYRSFFGPCAPHNGRIIADSDREFRLGVHKRTLGVRGDREQEKAYRRSQAIFILLRPDFVDTMATHIEEHKELHDYVDMYQAAEEHHAEPHEKLALRIQAWIDLEESGEFAEHLWLRRTLLKAKKNEWAKPDKPIRGIGDLGVQASLQGFVVTKILKNALAAAPMEFGGGHSEFISRPATSVLRKTFRRLMDPMGSFYFAYFSDDSAYSVRMPSGEVRLFNIDIKSCDCSHTQHVFDLLVKITPEPFKAAIAILVDQLRLPFEVVSSQDKRHKVRLQPHTAKLQSGSTLTTLINNIACLLIARSLSETRACTVEGIKRAGKACGYLLTVEHCIDYSQLQFLKHSPVYDTQGRVQPLLNLGVMFRSIGTCKGDLPGRGDIRTRALQFNGGLLHGMYPRVSFPLVDNLKMNMLRTTEKVDQHIQQMLRYKHVEDDDEYFSVSSADVYRRYSFPFEGAPLRADEYAELDDVFGRLTYEDHYASPATDKILRQDYGLRAKFTRQEPKTAR